MRKTGPFRRARRAASLDDAHADDGGGLLQLLDDLGRDRAVGVNERIGEVSAALVRDGVDVDLGVPEDARELADHVRLVLVADRHTAGLVHGTEK